MPIYQVRMMMKKIFFSALIAIFLYQPPVEGFVKYEDTSRFAGGFQRTLLSAFQLPFQTIHHTMSGPLGLGTVQGVLVGTTKTVTDMVGGMFDMAAAAAPYVKYAVLL